MSLSIYDTLFNISGMAGMLGAKKRCLWTDVDMQRAYNAIITNKLSISQAARNYSMPRMTLSDRVNDRISLNAKLRHETALNLYEEQSSARSITYMYQQCFPITRTQVTGLAWWRGFKRRHPSLTLIVAETVYKGRVNNATPDIIDDYFTKLQEIIEENDLSPNQTYNCDEVAILLNKHGQKVVVSRNAKHVQTLSHGSSKDISALCTIRADGGIITPLIIFSKGISCLRGFEKKNPSSYQCWVCDDR